MTGCNSGNQDKEKAAPRKQIRRTAFALLKERTSITRRSWS
jgi:hypothetical protein